ncbi:LamG-like jellyroll fold domain-containing protein, partial [Gimesia aquarii]|uniref:LamG-like jellyroll fold domain-containing protein n=1 Tax=Gimesia aquarii TaxID=2527964 RepID=UPI0018D6EC1B
MLLTNWLNALTSRIKKRPTFRSRDRRAIRRRWQAAVNNQISTTEVLEDRTLLTTFSLQSKLLPDPAVTPEDGDFAGNSVAVDGDWMLIGAQFDNNVNGSNAGAVYLYSRNDAGTPGSEADDTWDFHSTILSPNPVDPNNNHFGNSVDIDGDTLIISASFAEEGDSFGSAYIYTRTDPSATPANLTDDIWVHTTSLSRPLSLTGDLGDENDSFGTHVAISGSTAIVTARFDDIGGDASGSVYVFDTNDGWNTVFVSAITASDAVPFANFGTSASISGDTIIVGTPLDDTLAGNSGAVYIFERNDQTLVGDISDDTWDEAVKLTSANNGQFGFSVDIDGDFAVIGAWLESGGGAAYVYDGSAGWATPTQVRRLTASDATAGDRFGASASISGDLIVVGATLADNDDGAIYIYDGSNGWVSATEQKISDPAAQANDSFAADVYISGETIVVGAFGNIHDYGGATGLVESGAAYAFGPTLPSIVYVDDNFSNPVPGQDPDGPGGPATDFGFDAFATIQEAIDGVADGGIIHIAAGTYNPASTITVSKSVTIQGPQAGVDPRPGSGSLRDHTDATTEAIIDGGGALSRIFLIDADNVTLDGLVITNGTGDLIRSSNGVSQAIVQYNIIHNSSGDEGVQLAQTSNSSIQYNYIFDTTGDGANFAESSNGNISFNELNNIRSTNGAIYVYDSEAITIEGNYLDLGHLNLNDGIKVVDDIGADTTTSYIINNVVIDSLQDAINAERSNVVISGNDVSGSSSQNGVIYVSENVDNIQITNNSIHDNLASVAAGQINYAIRIGKGSDFPTNVVVRDNSIVNNEALIFFRQDTQATLDAARNWWGTTDHTVIAAGIVGVVDGLGATNGEIDFSTILTSGADTDGATPGFQPDTSSLLVHALGVEPAIGSRIQNAIDVVDDFGSIEIQAGTYNGDVTVGRGISLSGTPDIQGTLTVTEGATLAPGFSPGIILSNGLNILGETFELNNINLGSFTQLDVGPGEDLRYVESVQGENILFWRGSTGELRRATYTWNGTNLVLGAITNPTGLTSGDHASILNLGGGVLEGYFHPGSPSATGQFHAISNDGGQTWINETLITYPFSTPGIGSDSGTTGGGGIIELNGERRIYAQNNFGDIVLWTTAAGSNGPLTNIGALIDGGTGDFQNQSPSGDAIGLSSGQTLYLYVDGEGSESTLGAIGALIVDASGLGITSQIDNFISVSDSALTSAGLTSLDEMTIGAVQIVGNTITGVLMINGDSVSNGSNEDLFYAPITINTNTLPPGNLDIEINGTTPGTEHDQIDVTGTVTIGAGATLNLIDGLAGPGTSGDTIIFINNDGSDAVVGEFAGLANGSDVAFNGETWNIFYNGGDGNDVVLVLLSESEVFVNDDFTGPDGTVIVDADPNTVGNQHAIIGVNAFDTIQEGVDAVAVGGTVHITDQTADAGTYVENVTITKDITLRGTSGVDGDVTITPPAGDGITVSAAATSATIENLTVTGTTGVGILLLGLTGDVLLTNVTSTFNDIGVVASNVNNFTDIDGTYQSNNNGGILVEDITNNVTLTRTLLEDNNADGDPQGEGFTALANLNFNSIGGDLLVEGVVARDSDGAGSAADQLAAFFVGGVGGNATFQDSTGVVQSVLVEGHAFDGIALFGVAGDTNLTNVTSINNGTDPFGLTGLGGAGVVIAFSGSITDTNGNYSGNTNDGFTVFNITGDVRLNRTTLEDNNADDFGPGAGFSGGTIDGNFIAEGVTIRDTDGAGTAASQTDGVFIDGISGDITFQDSTDIVQSVTIEGHDEFGVLVEAFTSPASVVTFTNGTYSNNAEDGIHIDFVDGSATFSNVTVENNGGDGLQLFEIFGNVDINGGSFGGNHENGIEIEDAFDVALTNVTSSANLHAGIEVTFVDSFSDTDGTYQANEDAGIHLFDILGNVDLTRTILEDNNADDGDFGDGFTAVPFLESVAIGGDLIINGLTARSTNPGTTHQTAGVYVEGVDGSVVIDGSTDAVTISGNEEEGLSLIDVAGDVTLTDVSLTANALNSFVSGASILNIVATTGNVIDHFDINTPALGGEGFLQHTRGGVVQDIIETDNIGTLDIDFDAGDDTVTVLPHSTTLIDLNGGDPTIATGDVLTYITPVGETAANTPAGLDGGTISSTGGFADVVFDEFENLSIPGPLVVTGTSGDDLLIITATNANSGTYQVITDGVAGAVINFSNITDLTFDGLEGDDTLRIVNPAGGVFDPINGVFFNGGTGGEDGAGDTLEILGGTATSVEHRFVDDASGSVLFNGEVIGTITYTGLEPVIDLVATPDRIFSYSGADDVITLSDAGVAGQTFIDSTFGESVTFLNPTATFTINAGAGNDIVDVNSLDANFSASLTINGDADNDTINVNSAISFDTGNTVEFDSDLINVGNGVTITASGITFNGTTVELDGDLVSSNVAGDVATVNVLGSTGGAEIQDAIDIAGNGGMINVAAGSYITAGTLDVNESVSILGAGRDVVEILKMDDPTGNFDEAINISADNVTISGAQLGWEVHTPATDYQGYVVVTTADNTTLTDLLFEDNYRSAIVFIGADNLEVSDSIFDGKFGRAAIRDGNGGAGENFLITRNEFRADHFRWGPISIGPQGSGGSSGAYSGEISFNYFGNGLEAGSFQEEGDRNYTVTITNPGLTAAGLDILHNTFDWQDSAVTNGDGNFGQPGGIFFDPSISLAPGSVDISDNIFSGFTFDGPQPSNDPLWNTTGGQFGGALEFDGVDDFGIFQSALFDVGTAGTLNFWVNMHDQSQRNQFFEGLNGAGFEFQFRDNSGGQFFGSPGRSGNVNNFAIQDGSAGGTENVWQNLQYTWDFNAPGNPQMHIYIDGVEVAYLSATFDSDLTQWVNVVSTVSQLITVGRDASGDRHFDGLMDDVGWFNAALNQTDRDNIRTNGVAALTGDARLIAHWDFDQAAGNIAVDNENGIQMFLSANGISPLGPVFQPTGGQFGGALEFDGLDDFATFQDAAFDVGEQGTLNFWVNMADTGKRNQFFEGPGDGGLEFQYRDNGGGQFFGRAQDGADFTIQDGGAAGVQGVWTNVQYTWDANTGEMRIYLDGTEVTYLAGFDENLAGFDINNFTETIGGLMNVGRDPGDGTRFFAGLMDDIGWFDGVLNQTDRDDIRNNGVANLAGDPRLVAHWDLDDAPGTLIASGDSGTSIDLHIQAEPPAPPIGGFGVIAPLDASITNNLFFDNDNNSNHVLDPSNKLGVDPLYARDHDPAFNPATTSLEEIFAIGLGSPAAFMSTEFAGDPATTTPHIGAFQDLAPFGAGDIVINGSNADDLLEIVFTSETEATMTLTTGVGGPSPVVTGPILLTNITSFTFNGLEGDDILRITNPAGGLLNPTNGLFFNGGTGGEDGAGDTLEILGGVATSVEHRFVDNASGSMFFDGEGVATITYTGLEPVLDTIVATNRTFSFLGGAETITLSDDGVVGDGVSQIDSDNFGEVVAFLNATDSVTINTEAFGGSGVDAVNIEGLDSTFDADLTVNGGTDDTATFQTNATDLGSGDLTIDIGNVVLDQDVITTGNADLNASGGSITDGGSSAADALSAATAILTATVDVGGAGDAVDIDVANLEADAGGAINLDNNSGALLTIGGISGLQGLQAVTGIALTTDDDLQIDENINSTNGLIDIESTLGGITMMDGIIISSGTGDIELTADGDIDLTEITAAGNEVRLTSSNGSLTDNDASEFTGITADRVALRAATGIGGLFSDDINVDVNTLAASTTTGIIEIFDFNTIAVDTVDGLSGILGGGNIRLLSNNTIDVNQNVQSTGAASNVNVTAGNHLNVNASVLSNGGAIDLLAFNDISLGASTVVDTTTAALLNIRANLNASGDGAFTQSEGGVVDARGGFLSVTSSEDARIANLRSIGALINVQSVSGSIIDNTAGEAALITGNEVALRAATGIGDGNDIDTVVSVLVASSPGGNIEVSNTGALEIGTVFVGVALVGINADTGEATILTASPLTIASDVTAAGAVTLTAGDSAGPGDDLTINAGVTVESTGANVVLNAGDDFLLSLGGEVIANTTIEINVDPSGGDPDPVGSTVDLLGNVDATQTTINGGADADIFNILPTADSPITVNGGDPTLPGPGDVLNMDFSGLAAAPFLTLGATPGSGSFGFIAPDLEQTVDFTSIENVNSGGTPFHLVLDMFAAGFQNAADDTIDVQLDAAGTNLLIDVNASNFASIAAADILSFTVIGSTDNETLNINESPGGLPLFDVAAPVIPGSNGSHLNNAADTLLEDQFNPTTYDADDITIHYDGGDGTDAINVNFTTVHNAAYFSDNIDSLGSGNIVAATPAGLDIDLGLSFGAVEGVGINGAGGGLRVDASSTPLTTIVNIDDDGAAGDGVSQITANGGFANMVFSGFQGLQVVSGTGEELIDLIALDSATTVTQIELDADDVFGAPDPANDTIRVRSTPAGVTDINILAGLGDDEIQLFDASNTVNNIFADITVDGEGGNDTLTIIDSGDATGDTFEVTSTTVDGLSSAVGPDVTFAEIDNLNVTGTGGSDLIFVNMTTQEDLNNVVLNGFDGDDNFFLQNSTPVGVDTRLNGDAGEDDFIFLFSSVLRGFIDGGGDLDLLDYSNYNNAVHVALSGLGTIDGFQGRENNGSILGTGVAGLGFDNIDDLFGTFGSDILEGPDLNNYWGITGTDEGFLIADRPNLMSGRPTTAGDTIATPPEQFMDFTDFENLIGGNQQDRFDLSDGAGLTGTLDGALGNDSLDYRDFTTGVTVDLFAGTATNIGGGLVAGTGGGDDDNSIENVFGGDGNDNITGDNDNNILGDGFGSDNLDGGGNGVGSENGGNDVFLMEPGTGGSQDVITDIHGNDTIDFRFASQGILFDVDIINTPQDVFGGNTIELRQIQPQQPDTNPSFMENIVGSEFNDIIFIDPLSQDGNFPIDGPPVLRSADGRGGIDVLDFDAKGQEVIDTGFSLTADGVGTVQYLNFENVRPFEDTPAFIVDNGDLGFSLGGDWPFHPGGTAAITNGIGFENDVHSVREESPIGNGPAQAFWEFYGLTPGDYRISVTWPVSTNPTVIGQAATDAPYTIFDGARTDIGTAAVDLGTIDLNQQLEPDDFTADGTVWENLGVFTINSRTLTVMLTNLANGRITADAIRIERVSAGPEIELRDITDAPVPPTIIMDGHQGGINFGATE